MKEYRLGTFVQFFGYLFSVGFLIGAYFSAKEGLESSGKEELLFHSLALACLALAIFLTREIKISRFVIAVDRVYLVSMIYKRTLFFTQIKGWREVKEEFHILPNESTLKKIRVSTYFKNSNEIEYFLTSRFPNLDLVEAEEEKAEILKNEEFGATEEARAINLENARKAARYTSWLGWAITAWLFLYPNPYEFCVLAGIIYPILCIGVCFLYKGIIKGDDAKTKTYPSLLTTFLTVSLSLAVRSLLDINTLSYGNGWLAMAIVAVIMFVLYEQSTNRFSFAQKRNYFTLFLLPVFTFAYGFGVITATNSIWDRSDPQICETYVTNKSISKGKSRTYHLELKKWGDLKEDEEVTVTISKYNSTSVGDSINVYQYPGLLNMPWIEVE